jgi:hypothetical protein
VVETLRFAQDDSLCLRFLSTGVSAVRNAG